MTVECRPEPPLPVIADEPPWLAAYGDESQQLDLPGPDDGEDEAGPTRPLTRSEAGRVAAAARWAQRIGYRS